MPPNQEFYSHIEVNSVYAFKKWKNAEWNGGGRYWTKITTGNGISLFGLAKIDSHALGMGSIAFPIVLEQNMWVGLGEERQALFETNQKVFGFQNTLPNQLRAIGLNFDSGNIFGDFICASPHGPGISRFLIFTRFAQGVDVGLGEAAQAVYRDGRILGLGDAEIFGRVGQFALQEIVGQGRDAGVVDKMRFGQDPIGNHL